MILFTPFLAFEDFFATSETETQSVVMRNSIFSRNFLKGLPLPSFFLFLLAAYDVVCLRLREWTGLVETYDKGHLC